MRSPWFALAFAGSLVASACGATSSANATPTPTVSRPPEPQVQSFTPSPTSTIDTRPEARPTTPPAAILIDVDGTGTHLRARPVDPVTLADVPGYAPISFEHHYQAAVHPSGGTIAAVMWPGGNGNYGATVHLIDTARWIDRTLDTKIDAYTTALRFDATGAAVYWAQPVTGASTETTTALWKLDVASGSAREVLRLPANLYARDVQTLKGRVAVYAEPGGNVLIDGQRRDAPTVFVVDPASARIVATIPLPVRAGQYQDPAAATADEPWRQIAPGLAWDGPRSRLFVADAESERIFRVDLDAGTIAGPFEPKPRRSLADVLWALLGGTTAQAKMQSSDRQQATVSADGTRLYISGVRSTFAKGQDGKYHEQLVPLDLRVIDTAGMVELARTAAASTALWLAPDGSSLLYGSERWDSTAEGYATRSEWTLHLADGASARERASFPAGGTAWLASFNRDSTIAYVSWTAIVGGTLASATLQAVDLRAGRIAAAREMERHVADLLVVAPR